MTEIERVAVVTGSESGIGFAVAHLFLTEGYRVIGADLNNLDTENHRNDRFLFIPTDVADARELEGMFSIVESKFGRLDVLVNCAGITSMDSVDRITDDDWNRMMDVNLKSVFFASRRALDIMKLRRSGKIVNVSSNAGKSVGKAVGAHYSASKAGVISLTRSLAVHASEFGVNVNCVAPGPTHTPMTEGWEESVHRELRRTIPLGRFAEPLEVAYAIAFLVSNQSDYITGETLNVNGGLLMD